MYELIESDPVLPFWGLSKGEAGTLRDNNTNVFHKTPAPFDSESTVFTNGPTPSCKLLELISEDYIRRAQDLPLGALLHMTATLMKVFAPASADFLKLLTQRAKAELSQLKPFEVAFMAKVAAHFELRDPAFLQRLGRAVGGNLDSFSQTQIGAVAEALDLLG